MSTANYLATPPGSSRLNAQKTDFIPGISLGPAQLFHIGEHASAKRSMIPHRNDDLQAQSIYQYPAPAPLYPSSTNGEFHINKFASSSRKSKPSRKTMHSQIEKRRREKINDTMHRLKDLVPACHDQDLLLRKLDVLTATADYIEELHIKIYGRSMPVSKQTYSSVEEWRPQDYACEAPSLRRSKNQESASYNESIINTSDEERTNDQALLAARADEMEVDATSAAESLLLISESPLMRPMERHRLSINELMCRD